jgi:hypothetical protein
MKNVIEYKNPWYETDQDLTQQLKLEIASNHDLADKKVKTLAIRDDNDDVLYKILDEDSTYAIVHLTWKQSKHTNTMWPRTRIFKSSQKVQEQINKDNLDWE